MEGTRDVKYKELTRPIDEDMVPPPATSLDAIRASLARSRDDAAAGRVVDGSVVVANLKSMVEHYETQKKNGETNS